MSEMSLGKTLNPKCMAAATIGEWVRDHCQAFIVSFISCIFGFSFELHIYANKMTDVLFPATHRLSDTDVLMSPLKWSSSLMTGRLLILFKLETIVVPRGLF